MKGKINEKNINDINYILKYILIKKFWVMKSEKNHIITVIGGDGILKRDTKSKEAIR